MTVILLNQKRKKKEQQVNHKKVLPTPSAEDMMKNAKSKNRLHSSTQTQETGGEGRG
jgi:hypothetical protein